MATPSRFATALLFLLGSARADPGVQRGVCYAHTWTGGGRNGYGSEESQRSLARLRALGVDSVALTPFGFMSGLSGGEILIVQPGSGESDERLAREAARAHGLGMKVVLKPHLWLRGGAWQGDLTWADAAAWTRWWDSYRAFARHYAELAERESFDLYVIGTELKSATARDPAAWRKLIAEIRTLYHGQITYAANWDEADRVRFWDALDLIGVQAYQPIATHPNPTLDELRAGWRTVAARLAALAAREKKRIVLTELGYRPVPGAGMDPSAWPERDRDPRYDPAAQERCYRAAFEAVWGRPWLHGIYLWKWFTDSHDEQGPTDFSPAGKPAEKVIDEFYRKK